MKRIFLYVLILISLASLIGCTSGVTHDFNAQSVSSETLANSIVAPTLDEEIIPGKNIIYCSTFQLAWNELRDGIIGEDISLDGGPASVDSLNKSPVSKNDLSESDYVAMAGYVGDGIIDKINQDINEKFKGVFTNVQDIGYDDTVIVAYAFLYKNLRFEKEFEFLERPISFPTGNTYSYVRAFGIKEFSDKPAHKELSGQVDIFDYKSDDDFIIGLNSGNTDDEMILAKIKHSGDLGETVESVIRRVQDDAPLKLAEHDTLQIPKIVMNVTHKYGEFTGKFFMNKGFEKYFIMEAFQDVAFMLDEKGAILKSRAGITAPMSACPAQAKRLIFDQPFLLILKEKDSQHPYLALWIENTELLIIDDR